MKKPQLAALLVIFLCMSPAWSGELSGVLKNNRGVKKLQGEKSTGAYGDFTGALSDLPYSGEVHYNLGNAFLKNQEFEKAISEYQSAIHAAPTDSSHDRDLRFHALYNEAQAQTELKKNDEALELYQKALDLNPNSLETKTNMELLAQQQQGGGEGDNQDQKDKSDDKKNDDKKNQDKNDKKDDKDQKKPKDPEKFDNPKPSPRPFKSEELSQQDVKRILEELKRQEEQIRGRMENEQRKTAPPGKDW